MVAAVPVLALRGARLGFGGRPLFDGLDLDLRRGERACLVGRNGSGKSTLLRVLAGEIECDAGQRQLEAGARIGHLPQDPAMPRERTVGDFIRVADGGGGTEAPAHRVDAVLARLALDGGAALGTLSGGEARRAALARALVNDPEVLLLDEPTNHLDLPTIQWLEQELARFRGALLVISHDRAFLEAVSNVTLWLDRGRLHRLDAGFAGFDDWAETLRAAEAQELDRLGKQIAREERWLQRGVTARRRRNQGRLGRLQALRGARAELLRNRGSELSMAVAESTGRSQVVIEAAQLAKAWPDAAGTARPVIAGFSTRIRRGDRIGVVGRNGAGKTTLVNLLLGRLPPDRGELRLGRNLEIAVFDQRRESLDDTATLWRTLCPEGGDSVMVGERQKHVVGYLRDFLFDESQAKQPVASLSGGEKNRLLLARLFARPSNLLVLDEPTNDLDMDTLDLLVEVLDDYQGTLILVSHDRDFLDRLATSVILLDGRGGAVEYPGGYSDAMRQAGGLPAAADAGAPRRGPAKVARAKRPSGKLGYGEQRELDGLPARIDALGREIADLEARLADPDLYRRDPAAFEAAGTRLAAARDEQKAAETRWLELEEKRETLAETRS